MKRIISIALEALMWLVSAGCAIVCIGCFFATVMLPDPDTDGLLLAAFSSGAASTVSAMTAYVTRAVRKDF